MMDNSKSRTGLPRGLRTSLRAQLGVFSTLLGVVPVVLAVGFLTWFSIDQAGAALRQDALDKLVSIRADRVKAVEGYFIEKQNDLNVLIETAATLRRGAFDKLAGINRSKANAIVRLFGNWQDDIVDVSSDPDVVGGVVSLSEAFGSLGTGSVRSLYLGKGDLEDAGDGSAYSAAHQRQHGFFSGYIDIHDYPDAFLIDMAGDVVYSVRKSEVLGANLVSGDYRNSGLAELYQALKGQVPGQFYIADAAQFEGSWRMFIGSPIYSGTLQVGVLAYQLSFDDINAIIQDRTGLTSSAETYLVGRVGGVSGYRSEREVKAGQIGEPRTGVDVDKALSGQSGQDFKIGSTGAYEISVYEPLDLPGLNWAIISTASVAEIIATKAPGETEDFFAKYTRQYGYYDLFLIDPEGYVFYSVKRESDFEKNVLTDDPYKATNLGRLVAEVIRTRQFGQSDLERYAPSGDLPAAFMAQPLLGSGGLDLVLAVQLAWDEVSAVTGDITGLGDTGETFLVGPDRLPRTELRLRSDSLLNFKLESGLMERVLGGETAATEAVDYRQKPIFVAFEPVHVSGQNWGLIAKVDQDEALKALGSLQAGILIAGLLLALAAGVVAVIVSNLLANGLARPIVELTRSATAVAGGKLDVSPPAIAREDEVGQLADAFGTMTAQLRDMVEGLEARVAQRTRALEISAQVSRRLSTILDEKKLVSEVVEQVRSAFNYYYAQIYVLDQPGENLLLAGGTGEAGRTLLARHHSVPVGRGLVGRAAETGTLVLVPDVAKEKGWLPNPLLPETQSEVAVPIVVGEEVLGVLDVQHSVTGSLGPAEADLLQAIANQVAVGLRNARSYAETQQRAEREALAGAIATKIQSASTVDEAIKIAARELGRATGGRTRVRLATAPSEAARRRSG
ncbi:MAG: GAF domain-containing protein [Thermoflexales bacterium]|nr:GAF domain-containing protein [Thermoflexales bacterium]